MAISRKQFIALTDLINQILAYCAAFDKQSVDYDLSSIANQLTTQLLRLSLQIQKEYLASIALRQKAAKPVCDVMSWVNKIDALLRANKAINDQACFARQNTKYDSGDKYSQTLNQWLVELKKELTVKFGLTRFNVIQQNHQHLLLAASQSFRDYLKIASQRHSWLTSTTKLKAAQGFVDDIDRLSKLSELQFDRVFLDVIRSSSRYQHYCDDQQFWAEAKVNPAMPMVLLIQCLYEKHTLNAKGELIDERFNDGKFFDAHRKLGKFLDQMICASSAMKTRGNSAQGWRPTPQYDSYQDASRLLAELVRVMFLGQPGLNMYEEGHKPNSNLPPPIKCQ